MPSRDLGVPVDVLRNAARERAEATSLRAAAREIGMSWRGLEAFMEGTRPHPATVRKLTAWYLKRVAAGELEVSAEAAEAAFTVLLSHIPAERRQAGLDRLTTCLREFCVSEGVALPSWLPPPGSTGNLTS